MFPFRFRNVLFLSNLRVKDLNSVLESTNHFMLELEMKRYLKEEDDIGIYYQEKIENLIS